jgi:outer membrane receptor protein involved in Fe transport
VPLSFPATAAHSAFDLERIEVLKGPQGTLFGQNATGGAINYIAAKPTSTLQGGVDVSYGRFNEVDGEVFISGPLAENLQGRLTGRIERMDGWQQSFTRPGDKNGRKEAYMGRLQLAYQPLVSVRFLLNINGWKDEGQTQAPQYVAYLPQHTISQDPVVAAAGFAPATPRAADWTPGLPYKDNSMWQTSLRSDIDLLDAVTVTSLTSYVNFEQNMRNEGDGLALSTLDLTLNNGNVKSFSQELRVSNIGSAGTHWVIGGNYEHSHVDQYVDVYYPNSTTFHLFTGIPPGYPNLTTSYYFSKQEMKNYAVFGNIEQDFLSQFTVKGGVRYTKADRSSTNCSTDGLNAPFGIGDFFYNVIYGGAYGSYAPGNCYVFNDQAGTINGVAPNTPGEYAASLDEHNVSWRGGLDWKPDPHLLVYANIAKGYKAGSFPTVSATTFTQFLPVTQESVLAYEIGYKTNWLDHKIEFDGAVFYDDYKDKQLRSKLDAPPWGILDVLQNIPKSTIKGFELNASLRPITGLIATLAYTYLDAKIDEFVGINAAGVAADFAGTRVPFTPKHQVGFGVDYNFPLGRDLDGFVGSTVNYRSSTVSVVGGDIAPATLKSLMPNPLLIDGYTTVDLRVGVNTSDGRWRVMAFGKNVFDKFYWNNVVTAFDTVQRYAGMPATYGLDVSYHF